MKTINTAFINRVGPFLSGVGPFVGDGPLSAFSVKESGEAEFQWSMSSQTKHSVTCNATNLKSTYSENMYNCTFYNEHVFHICSENCCIGNEQAPASSGFSISSRVVNSKVE